MMQNRPFLSARLPSLPFRLVLLLTRVSQASRSARRLRSLLISRRSRLERQQISRPFRSAVLIQVQRRHRRQPRAERPRRSHSAPAAAAPRRGRRLRFRLPPNPRRPQPPWVAARPARHRRLPSPSALHRRHLRHPRLHSRSMRLRRLRRSPLARPRRMRPLRLRHPLRLGPVHQAACSSLARMNQRRRRAALASRLALARVFQQRLASRLAATRRRRLNRLHRSSLAHSPLLAVASSRVAICSTWVLQRRRRRVHVKLSPCARAGANGGAHRI